MITALGWPVYVKPQLDELRRADAIFVLGGSGDAAYALALEYALQGLTTQVVFSNPNGAEAIWLTDLCSHQRYRFNVSCVEPDPPTTRGEAHAFQRLAESKGWHSVIVLAQTPHISRARYILERCFHGDLMMGKSETELWPLQWAWSYVYQTAGYVRAAVQSGC
jgi:uncharacterized SAM-binding protein YcdF (DUF218 family)